MASTTIESFVDPKPSMFTYVKTKLVKNNFKQAWLNNSVANKYPIILINSPFYASTNVLFLYLPSSGIAPSVGTAGTVHDAYT